MAHLVNLLGLTMDTSPEQICEDAARRIEQLEAQVPTAAGEPERLGGSKSAATQL